MNKRPNIALVIPYVDNENTAMIISGAISCAEKNDINLFIIPVRYVRGIYNDKERSGYLYQFTTMLKYITPQSLDGVVIESASIGTFVSAEEMKQAMSPFEGLPVVTLAQKFDGFSSVSFNCDGIKEELRHLIQHHNIRNIGFVSGPASIEDSIKRFKAYREVLREFDIPFDNSMYAEGNFSEYSQNAVRQIFNNNPDVEAICFANDRMAIAGYQVAAEFGRTVGSDIFFVGYDDAPCAMTLEPKLTTVHTDIPYMAYKAVELCAECIQTHEVQDIILDSQMVCRESCGCNSLLGDFQKKLRTTSLADYQWDNLIHDIRAIFNEDAVESCLEPMFSFIDKLYSLARGQRIEFDVTNSILYDIYNGIDYHIIQLEVLLYVLEIIKKKLLEIAFDNGKYKSMSEITEKITQFMIYNGYDAVQRIQNDNRERYRLTSDIISGFLTHLDDGDKCYTTICKNLFKLGINTSHLFVNERIINFYDNGIWKRPEKIRYVCSSYGGQLNTHQVELVDTNDIFRICSSSNRQHTVLISPVYYCSENYGVLACELDVSDYSYFTSFIHDQINFAFKMKNLTEEQIVIHQQLRENLEQIKTSNEKLNNISRTDELTGILNRRGFIQSASELITSPQNKGKEALLVFIDMNNLKKVNDNYGHNEGDYSLKAIANIMKRCFRGNDIIARIGGDEYAALAFVEVANIQEILRKRIAMLSDDLNQKSGKPYYITVSVGMHKFNCDSKVSLSEMMKKSDDALYEDKKKKPSSIVKPTKLCMTV